MDTDRSGDLDAAELSQAISSIAWNEDDANEKHDGKKWGVTVEEAAGLIAHMRLNHSGIVGTGDRLTFDDFLQMMECFSFANPSPRPDRRPPPASSEEAIPEESRSDAAVEENERLRAEHLEQAFNLVRAAEFMGERYLEDKLKMDEAKETLLRQLDEVRGAA